ncbi:MAG TPA: hypothetical protein P5511_04185, partial [Candidatus Goldiibacteriota bacterium]|nr:hypothetical protein [Candidatus Goldiibacteriota bacterium]
MDIKKYAMAIIVASMCSCVYAAGALTYRVIYSAGEVRDNGMTVSSGKEGKFIIRYGPYCEIRGDAGTSLKFSGNAFELRSGRCFVRAISETGGAGQVSVISAFGAMTAKDAAFCVDRESLSVYSGAVSLKTKKGIMRVNAGMEYRGFTLRQVKNAADEWLNWNFKRDKEDIYVELDAAGKDQKLMDYLKKALTSYYFIGIVNEASYQEAGDTVAHITITAGAGGLNASGTVKSGFEAYITPIDLSTGVSGAGNPYLSSEFMPFVYRLAGQISQAVISAQISGMKEGRMVLIELETDDEKLVERAGAQL